MPSVGVMPKVFVRFGGQGFGLWIARGLDRVLVQVTDQRGQTRRGGETVYSAQGPGSRAHRVECVAEGEGRGRNECSGPLAIDSTSRRNVRPRFVVYGVVGISEVGKSEGSIGKCVPRRVHHWLKSGVHQLFRALDLIQLPVRRELGQGKGFRKAARSSPLGSGGDKKTNFVLGREAVPNGREMICTDGG